MKRSGKILTIAGAGALVALVAMSGYVSARPAQGACDPPCTLARSCVPTSSGISCQEHCQCPGGETPGSPPGATVFPVTPRPSPTPPPGGNVHWCLPNECRPGETRLWLFWYLYNLNTYVPVRPIEPCCGDSCPCGEPSEVKEPCTPGVSTSCSEWGASVQASLPVWYANRMPYPRTMVTLNTAFWASRADGAFTTQLPVEEKWGGSVDPGGGACDDDEPPPGTICDFKLGLLGEPANNVPPTWHCEGGGGGAGWQVSCVWDYSSAGKPYVGRGVNCESLPAFTVSASVPYWWSLGRQWEQWEKVGEECKPEWEEDPEGGEGHWKEDCDPIYGWVHHGPNWTLLDLTLYGHPTPYMLNPRVQLAPVRDCGPHPVGKLYVPCIEVQGVISNPKEP